MTEECLCLSCLLVLQQNLSEKQQASGGTSSSEEDILRQYRQRKQAQAQAQATSASQQARRTSVQRDAQQGRDAAAKLREQMERMERMATQVMTCMHDWACRLPVFCVLDLRASSCVRA